MNILFLTTHLNHGGITSYTFGLAERLVRRRHNVFVGSGGGDLQDKFVAAGITVLPLFIRTKSELNPKVLISLMQLRSFLKKQRIDLIHAQTRVSQVLAWHLSRFSRIPVITTCHGFFRRNIGRQVFPCWGSRVIAISEPVQRHLVQDFFVPEKNIVLIPNGINTDAFRISPERFAPEKKDRRVGIVARLSSVKGHRYLVEAMARVLPEYPDARLFIFGEGSRQMKRELVQLAQKLKIDGSVLFLPNVSNTAHIMQEIDIFVMPSTQEGLGLSLLEAQACGLPVIGSRVGGIPTVITHDVSGLLVPPQDAESLAAAIMKIMDNRTLAIDLGRNGRRHVEERFGLERMVDRVEDIYAEVTGAKAS